MAVDLAGQGVTLDAAEPDALGRVRGKDGILLIFADRWCAHSAGAESSRDAGSNVNYCRL